MKRKIFLILLSIVIISSYLHNKTEITIPNESIRLRVIPNSNETKDIIIKEQVKDYLETDIYTLLKDVNNINEARELITSKIPTIEKNIDSIFKLNNYNLPYKVNYGNNYFPEKTYQGKEYSEGEYESLVIYIGESSGDNWWCVLFPNYCLIDTDKEITYKSYFKELINKIF